MQTFSYSDKGPRPGNQDSFYLEIINEDEILSAVADGVGGNKGGETASQTAINEFFHCIKQNKSAAESIKLAHEIILNTAAQNVELNGMATTFTAAILRNRLLTGIHSGDSRAYILRGKGIKQLTVDHTELERLLSEGKITRENAINYPRKNVLESALGTHRTLITQEFKFHTEPKDRVILITDGIYGKISKKEIVAISRSEAKFEIFCKRIIDSVASRDPDDNFTLIGFEIN